MKVLTQPKPTGGHRRAFSARLVVATPRLLNQPDRLRPLGFCFIAVMLLFGRIEVSGAGGSVTRKVGSPIPDSSAPVAGYQLTGLTVVIEPAEARTAGATWHPQGGTTQLTSGASLLLLVSEETKRSLQFSTVAKFQTPTQPSITLTRGFENVVIFTYARTLPPVLPASADANGTRAVTFAYTPPVTGGAATGFSVAVGGGETLDKLGLTLTPATGRLDGIPTKTGTFSLVFTATNAVGKSQSMTLTLIVTDPGQLVVKADAARGSVVVSPNRSNLLFSQSDDVVLTAKAKLPGFLFDSWQFIGVTPTSLSSPTTSFAFTPTQLLVTAAPNFVVNPFLSRADTYNGRIAPGSGVELANVGMLTLTTTNLGQYTGRLKFGTGSYSFKSQFHPDGKASPVAIHRSNKTPPLSELVISELQMDLALGGSEQITGTLEADGNTIPFILNRAVFDAKGNPCPEAATDPESGKPVAARYTVALRRDPAKPANQYPQGHGCGIATVNPNGTVRFTGTLGDGTPLT
ncbi:MAG: Ig domain-containing protein, partial [Chthoniobacteraceae bacterium]